MIRPWVVTGRAAALQVLDALIAAHGGARSVRVVPLDDASSWRQALPGAETLLVIGNPNDSPRSAVSGAVADDNGRAVPVGWMPEDDRLAAAAVAIARVAKRSGPVGPVLLLASQEQRSVAVLDQVSARLRTMHVHRWEAARVVRPTLLPALRSGAGVALYAGHGTPLGWVAYGGVTAADFAGLAEPLGAVLSLTCRTASRHRVGRSFAEEVVGLGGAAAVLAAAGDVPHRDNAALATWFADGLAAGAMTIADLLSRTSVQPMQLRHYRLIGDPAASLAGAFGAATACAAVPAPAPWMPPPPLPPGWWPPRRGDRRVDGGPRVPKVSVAGNATNPRP